MRSADFWKSLEFYEYLIVNYKIWLVRTYFNAVVTDRNILFALKWQPCFLKFDFKRTMIDLLFVPETKIFSHGKQHTADFVA